MQVICWQQFLYIFFLQIIEVSLLTKFQSHSIQNCSIISFNIRMIRHRKSMQQEVHGPEILGTPRLHHVEELITAKLLCLMKNMFVS
jgi:hypothetical protein